MGLITKPIENKVNAKLRLLIDLSRIVGLNVSKDKLNKLCLCLGFDVRIRHDVIQGKMTYEEADALLDKMLAESDKFKEAFVEVMFETCDELFKRQGNKE